MSDKRDPPAEERPTQAVGPEACIIATGDRREEVHFEPDPDQLVVARHLVRPAGPLPPQDHSAATPSILDDVPPVEDVLVAPQGPSVWDARPVNSEDG